MSSSIFLLDEQADGMTGLTFLGGEIKGRRVLEIDELWILAPFNVIEQIRVHNIALELDIGVWLDLESLDVLLLLESRAQIGIESDEIRGSRRGFFANVLSNIPTTIWIVHASTTNIVAFTLKQIDLVHGRLGCNEQWASLITSNCERKKMSY